MATTMKVDGLHKAGHLYQMAAYLHSMEEHRPPRLPSAGVLLYAQPRDYSFDSLHPGRQPRAYTGILS